MVTKEEELRELVEHQAREMAGLQETAWNALSAPLTAFEEFYSLRPLKAMIRMLADLLRGFESVAARFADGYLSDAASIMTGKVFRPEGTRRTKLGREGVDDADVIGRIADTYRWQQGQLDKAFINRSGDFLSLATPKEAALDRLHRITETNLQMASRSQMRTNMLASDKITGYRRIIHPELAHQGTCGLCIAAADRHYHKGVLLPIHPGCHCTVLPEVEGFDPHVINQIDLDQLQGETNAEALRQTRFKIDEHGEIGPVLRPEGEPIRRPSQNARRSTVPQSQLVRKLQKRRDQMTQALAEQQATLPADAIGRVEDRIKTLEAEIQRLEAA